MDCTAGEPRQTVRARFRFAVWRVDSLISVKAVLLLNHIHVSQTSDSLDPRLPARLQLLPTHLPMLFADRLHYVFMSRKTRSTKESQPARSAGRNPNHVLHLPPLLLQRLGYDDQRNNCL